MFLPLALASLSLALLVYGIARRLRFAPEPAPRIDWLWPLERRLEAALLEVRWNLPPWQFRTVMLLDALFAGWLAWTGNINLPWWLAGAVGGVLPLALLAGRVVLRRRQMRRAAAAGLPLLGGLLALQPDPALALRAAMPHLASPLQEEVAWVLKAVREEKLSLGDALQLAAMRCGDDLWLHGLAVLVTRPGTAAAPGVLRLAAHCRKLTQLEG